MTRVARLHTQHLALCEGNRVVGIYVTRREARRKQRTYNHRRGIHA